MDRHHPNPKAAIASARQRQDERRFPIGAEPRGDGTHFRVWAPAARSVRVVAWPKGTRDRRHAHALTREDAGYHAGFVSGLGVGAVYGFELDANEKIYPDPASRFQPEGVHGPSAIVDPLQFEWQDARFNPVTDAPRVIYEMHIGTFTREGTYRAAAAQLPELAALGITTLELMPLAEFPGHFGWGYDGTDPYAPTRLYGTPDELRAFVDRAHSHGLSLILDVVYNHLGNEGNYLKAFAPAYFSDRYENEWGDALNFDGEHCASVREFFVQNARYWIEEFHFDGLRLDATQSIFDASERHVIAEINAAARAAGERLGKRIFIVAENEPQDGRLARATASGGYDCDALWNDDFHHSATVALTGRHEAYYSDYRGRAQELISAIQWGYLYQGQHYYWQHKTRGQSALDLRPESFVTYLQNHDQIANSLRGQRIHELVNPAALRALTALLLLAPPTPMLFQGQEFAASAPFLYFADPAPDAKPALDAGRKKFLAQFATLASGGALDHLPSATEPRTFERCKLDFGERDSRRAVYDLHRDLLRLRRDDPAFSSARSAGCHAATLSETALLLRFVCAEGDRLLLVNLGADLELRPAPEPLLAPPFACDWSPLWSSDDPRYGGLGAGEVFCKGKWRLPANSAQVFKAVGAHAARAAQGEK